jgi:hypothetical protein
MGVQTGQTKSDRILPLTLARIVNYWHAPTFAPQGRGNNLDRAALAPNFWSKKTGFRPSGTVGVTPDPNGVVQEGDCFVLRLNADASNAANTTSITDSGIHDNVYPNGMTPGAEVGNLIP